MLCSSWPVTSIVKIALIPGLLSLLATVYLVREAPSIKQSSHQGSKKLPTSFFLFLIPLILFGLGNFNRTLLLLRVQKSFPGSMLSTITLLYMFRNAVQSVASYSMGALSDRIGRMVLLALGGFGCFSLMSLILMWPSPTFLSLIAVFFLSGVSAGTVTSLEKSATADLLPEELRGTAYGILQTSTGITDLVSSILVGFIWTHYSAELAFLYAALMSMAAGLVLLRTRS